MAGKPNIKMPVSQRAKQFMPFAAVRGLNEALAQKEKILVPKIEMSEERAAELDQKMRSLTKGQMVTVVYFEKGEYIRKTGILARLDVTANLIQVVDTKINFENIYDIE